MKSMSRVSILVGILLLSLLVLQTLFLALETVAKVPPETLAEFKKETVLTARSAMTFTIHLAVVSKPPCVPLLISPGEGELLDNGRNDRQDDIIWDFDWSDCPGATKYNLYVQHEGSVGPVIDHPAVVASSYHYVGPGSYIIESNRFDWYWKVRSYASGKWSDWSEVRTFDVEPLNTDPPNR